MKKFQRWRPYSFVFVYLDEIFSGELTGLAPISNFKNYYAPSKKLKFVLSRLTRRTLRYLDNLHVQFVQILLLIS